VTRRRVRTAIATLLLAAGLLVALAQPAAASPGAYQVLFAKGEDSCEGDTGLQTQLAAMPHVAKVDVFDTSSGTPSVAQLDPYDMVVTMSDCDGYADQDALGNNLADYADHGGVVVQYAFTMQSGSFALAGRWLSGGYAPYVPGSNSDTDVTLGEHDAASPLMAGVNGLVSQGCNTDPTLAPGATRVAQWNDGLEAIALKGQAVAVNAGIEDTSCGWSGDFARLTYNAMTFLTPPYGTSISKKKIKPKKHTARFEFSASGNVAGFECSLSRSKKKKKGKKSAAPFSACASPKLYKHLKSGRYTFKVRATNAHGPDATPATKKFKI
jgi:hypothetical protein